MWQTYLRLSKTNKAQNQRLDTTLGWQTHIVKWMIMIIDIDLAQVGYLILIYARHAVYI